MNKSKILCQIKIQSLILSLNLCLSSLPAIAQTIEITRGFRNYIVYGNARLCGSQNPTHELVVLRKTRIGITVRQNNGDPTYKLHQIKPRRKLITTDSQICGEDDESGITESDSFTLREGRYILEVGNYDNREVDYSIRIIECSAYRTKCSSD